MSHDHSYNPVVPFFCTKFAIVKERISFTSKAKANRKIECLVLKFYIAHEMMMIIQHESFCYSS